VHVWGTRASADDYAGTEGSDLTGLHYAQVNVSSREDIEAYAATFEQLDILICCQGIVRYNREEFEPDGWDAVMDVNLRSVMDCGLKFHPMLADSSGAFIIVSSVSGFQSNLGNPAYAASKAGAVSLTKSLGEAWARDEHRTNWQALQSFWPVRWLVTSLAKPLSSTAVSRCHECSDPKTTGARSR
jgi:3-oxoacyl-[acyl-carrier protein] reductase